MTVLGVAFSETGFTLVWRADSGRVWTGFWHWSWLPSWPMEFT